MKNQINADKLIFEFVGIALAELFGFLPGLFAYTSYKLKNNPNSGLFEIKLYTFTNDYIDFDDYNVL